MRGEWRKKPPAERHRRVMKGPEESNISLS
jgi:hypothetical protein